MTAFARTITTLLLLITAGCVSLNQPAPDIQYYTFDYPSPELQSGTVPCILEIPSFTIAPSSNSNKIIYKEDEFTTDQYFYHRWRANPALLVSDFLRRDFQASGIFRTIVGGESRIGATHVLEGRVDRILEKDTPDGWYGLLSVTATLLRADESDVSSRVLWQKTYSRERLLDRKNPQALVRALSGIMADISRTMILDVHTTLEEKACE